MDIINISNKEGKAYKGSRTESLIKQKAIDIYNKLESKPIVGLENEKIQGILENSDFKNLRKENSENSTLEGKSAIGIIPFADSYLLIALKVISHTLIGKMEQKITGLSGATFEQDGVEYPVYTEYKFNKDSEAILSRYIKVENDKNIEIFEIEKDYNFKTKFLPVELFKENHKLEPAVEYFNVIPELQRLRYLDSELTSEFNLSRQLPYFNENFTEQNPESETRKLKQGQGYVADDSYNNKIGNGTAILPANGAASSLLGLIIGLEDDIKNKLGMKRDADMNATNKTVLEIALRNEYQLDMILSQLKNRESHYNQLFGKLYNLLKIEFNGIELLLNDITQNLLDQLEASKLEAMMKTQNKASQIDGNGE